LVTLTWPNGETPINLCLSRGLEAVQESLRKQGKPLLQVSERTLTAQLGASGWLLDENNQPMDKEAKGVKTKQITVGGDRKRCVRMRIGGCGVRPIFKLT